ncbi:MAG TPA: FAD-dependent oxidoreductase [Candidatus Binatia bacterium]|nr:FAD-dependent oxidoreductase [Candidatus Binatia bacterium]
MTVARAAVVGGGIGGLVAAGVLARAGAAVTLFEAADVLGGKARRLRVDGLTLDTGPTLLTMPGVVAATFDAIGARDLLPPLQELRDQCTYHFADGRRFTARRDVAAMLDEAEALEPGGSAALRGFYADAAAIHAAAGAPYLEEPFDGMVGFMRRVARRGPAAVLRGMAMGTLAGFAARHFRGPALRQFAGRFATYVGAAPEQVSAAFALIPHLEQAQGVYHVEGGMAALVDAMTVALVRLGVTIRRGAAARWTERGRGFVVGPSGGEIEADVVVVNADPLGPAPAGPLALSGYVLLLDVPRRLALPHHAVLFSADYPREFRQLLAGDAPDDPTVYVCHPAASDQTMAPAGRSGLFVMANAAPLRAATSAWLDAETMRVRCLRRLAQLVPAIEQDATVIGERTPADFARDGAPRGSLYGFLPRGRFGPFRRPRMRGTPPGVFFAGGGTHPGGGVPMVMLSGRWAAGMALEHTGMAVAS